jgi:hypothetical protein
LFEPLIYNCDFFGKLKKAFKDNREDIKNPHKFIKNLEREITEDKSDKGLDLLEKLYGAEEKEFEQIALLIAVNANNSKQEGIASKVYHGAETTTDRVVSPDPDGGFINAFARGYVRAFVAQVKIVEVAAEKLSGSESEVGNLRRGTKDVMIMTFAKDVIYSELSTPMPDPKPNLNKPLNPNLREI